MKCGKCGQQMIETEYLPMDEEHPLQPSTPYDIDKLASEYMIKAYANAYELKYTIFRFGTVYGPRQRVTSEWNPVIANFIDTIKRREKPYVTGDGLQTRDFIYVSDIVDALVKGAALSGNAGPLLLGSGVETSINEVLKAVCHILGVDVKYTARARPLGEIQRMSYDCAKAKKILGWSPEVSLEEGIRKILESWKY